jgi:succinyl-diaminopimelate desuccinylase
LSEQFFGLLSNIITKESGTNPKASTAGGTSDARFVAEYGIKVLEFGVRNETIHAPNECVKIAEIEKLTAIFQKLIGDFSLKI